MTQRDFILIAGVLRAALEQARERPEPMAAPLALEDVARRFAHVLADDNTRFNRGLFLEACGVGPDIAGRLELARRYARGLRSGPTREYAVRMVGRLEDGDTPEQAFERVRWPEGLTVPAGARVRAELERIMRGERGA